MSVWVFVSKRPTPKLFGPMRDSCHSFLSCDHGHKNGPIREGVKGQLEEGGGSRGWGHVMGGDHVMGERPLTKMEGD